MSTVRVFWEFARPFTLLTPAAGMAAGGLIAWGADPRYVSISGSSPGRTFLNIALGAVMASVMNAGSNGLNQIYDLEIDRINKPRRPLPSGSLKLGQAWSFTVAALAVGLLLAWAVSLQCLALAAAAGLLTASYSVPPARTKRWGWIANATVAIPRGLLLPVAGWSAVKTIFMPEPWLLGIPLGLFMFGANSTKDFSDIEGDRAGGCMTLPVRYGVRRTALFMAPFFVFPFALWALFARLHYLSAPATGMYLLAGSLPLLGVYIDFRILRNPEELGSGENHVSWRLIYLMAVATYAGLALAYLWPR
jgi:4-hydroxybenzoate polyprenyltransferase